MRQWMKACYQMPVNSIASSEPKITSPLRQRGMHAAGRRPDHHRQRGNADQQRLIGFLPSASQPRRNIAAAHQRTISGREMSSSFSATSPGAPNRGSCRRCMKRPRHDVAPEGDRPITTTRVMRPVPQARSAAAPAKSEHKGQRNPHTMHHPIMAIPSGSQMAE